MKEEVAENKLLRLLKESKVDHGKEVSATTLPSGGPNKLLELLRSKSQDPCSDVKEDTKNEITVKASPPVLSSYAREIALNTRTASETIFSLKPDTKRETLSVLQLYVFVTSEELDLLEKLTQETSSFAALLILIFGHNLMAREIPVKGAESLSSMLGEYVRQQSSILHRLLVKARLGQEVVLGQFTFPEHDRLQVRLLDGLASAMRSWKEARVPSLSVETGRLILVSSLTPERLRFFQKISQERQHLGMVLHLFFSHLLMAQEVVVQSAGQLAQAFAINELLAKYRAGQDALLNRLLLATRMQRPINLKEDNPEQQVLLRKLLECFRQLV